MTEPARTSEVWKWIAAVMAAFLLASVPGFVYALRTPTSAEVDIIRQRQVEVLVRLGVVEEQLRVNERLLEDLREELERHRERDTTAK